MKTNTKKSEKVKSEKPSIIGASTKVSSSKLEGLVKKKKAEQEEPTEKKKKKSKEGKVKKEKGAKTERATNYNFPADCTSPKDRKKFRTAVRKKNEQFENRLAEAKAGTSKEKESTINKEWAEYKSTVYLSTKEAA